MKKIFSIAYISSLAHVWLLLLRLSAGAFMLTHGYPKLQKLLEGGDIQFYDFIGIGATASLALAVFAEFFCSILLMLGLATRLASFFLVFTMAVAAFLRHAGDPFSKRESALIYLLLFLTILVFGPGKYSLDALIGKGGEKKKPAKGKR